MMDHMYGGVPPVAASTALKATPVCPVGSEEVEIVRDAGGGSVVPALEPPPQALKAPVAMTTIMARNEFRMGDMERECRCLGFMALEIPTSEHGISRGIFLYHLPSGERVKPAILYKPDNSRSGRSAGFLCRFFAGSTAQVPKLCPVVALASSSPC